MVDIDIAGLVADGLLDLGVLFCDADWVQDGDVIASYGACDVIIQSATAYGITAYRAADGDDGVRYSYGPVTLDREEAVAWAQECADEQVRGMRPGD